MVPSRTNDHADHTRLGDVKAFVYDEVVNTVRKQITGLLTGIVLVSVVLRAMCAKCRQVFRLIVLEEVLISMGGSLLALGVVSFSFS